MSQLSHPTQARRHLVARHRSLPATGLLTATVLSSGLLVGFFLTYGFTIMPGLATTEDPVFVEAFQGLERTLGDFDHGVNLPVLLGYLCGPVLMALAALLVRRSRRAVTWVLVALALTLITIAITQLVHVPLNTIVNEAGDPDGPASTAVRDAFDEDRWRAWNHGRSATALGAFGCAILALTTWVRELATPTEDGLTPG